jgi:hypothetical protein
MIVALFSAIRGHQITEISAPMRAEPGPGPRYAGLAGSATVDAVGQPVVDAPTRHDETSADRPRTRSMR